MSKNNYLKYHLIDSQIHRTSGLSLTRSEYPWVFNVLRTERRMARRFAKVLEKEIEEAFLYPSDWVNTKTTIPLRVGEERWIYIPRRIASRYIPTTIHLPFGRSLYTIAKQK